MINRAGGSGALKRSKNGFMVVVTVVRVAVGVLKVMVQVMVVMDGITVMVDGVVHGVTMS